MDNKAFSLRKLCLNDTDRMLEWMRDPDITRFLRIGGSDTKREAVEEFIRNCADERENLHRAVVDARGDYLGTVTLKHIDREKKEAEYAISMHLSALGTGASAAASSLIVELAFEELGLERVYLNVLEENQRAVKFYQKFGFQYTHITEMEFGGEPRPLLWFEIKRN